MGQFLAIIDSFLREHTGEMLLHEGIEISIAFPGFEVLPLE